MCLYVWLDLQRMGYGFGYGFGYGSLWSLAVLVHCPAEPSPFILKSSVGTSASDRALVICPSPVAATSVRLS